MAIQDLMLIIAAFLAAVVPIAIAMFVGYLKLSNQLASLKSDQEARWENLEIRLRSRQEAGEKADEHLDACIHRIERKVEETSDELKTFRQEHSDHRLECTRELGDLCGRVARLEK